jgi:small-conductance mechanosensitive channel
MKEFLEYKLFEVGTFSITVWSLISLALIYVLTRIAIAGLSRLFKRFAERREMDRGRQVSFLLFMRYLLWVFGVSMMITSLGIQLTFLLASSAALLVGLGLGLQQIFSDFVSGIFLLFEGTIEVGDILQVGNVVGKVEKINLRTTIFRDRNDIVMIIPNHKFIAENVINWSHENSVSRFIINVTVAYSSDMELVKNILNDCLHQHKDVITNQVNIQPNVRIADFLESGVQFEMLFYSENMFRIDNTKSDIRMMVWKAFQDHKVIIPYHQIDINVKRN